MALRKHKKIAGKGADRDPNTPPEGCFAFSVMSPVECVQCSEGPEVEVKLLMHSLECCFGGHVVLVP